MVNLEPDCVVIYGENGCGKTNLLEAISLLSPGRGLRRATYKQLCSLDSITPFIVNALLQSKNYGDINLGTTVNSEAKNRKLYIDSNLTSMDSITDYCNILWLTPLMDRLFLGPASDRSKFLDRLVLSVDSYHGKRFRNYEKLIKARTCVLQESHIKNKILDIYEHNIAILSTQIIAARHNIIKLLNQSIENSSYKNLFIQANIYIKGEIEELIVNCTSEQAITKIEEQLYKNREIDKLSNRCKLGPHKSDFCVEHKTKNIAANLCSTGEQKSLLINLILSQIELNIQNFKKYPILLLDEVAAHLDNKKLAIFLEILYNLPIQTIMTGTDKNLFIPLHNKAQFINLSAIPNN